MGLEIPNLDDRTYEELVTDARKRIPIHSDNWTDHNASDPGITMLEVLAWVAESDIYQLDRVTERYVQKYLWLLGVRPRSPLPATVRLQLDPSSALTGQMLPEATMVTAEDAGTERRFTTTSRVPLTEASVAAVVSDTPSGRVDNTHANRDEGLHFHPFGSEAAKDSAVYLGFDAEPFDAGRLNLHVDFRDEDIPALASHGDEERTFEPTAMVVWEHCTNYDQLYNDAAWSTWDPTDIEDETTHWYDGGTVSLPEPDDWTGIEYTLFDREKPLFWLRARVEAPNHELPPQVNAIETSVVKAVHEVTHRDERLQRISEGSSAEATRKQDDETTTTTTARPGQEFVLARAPVLDAAVAVGSHEWTRVEDLDASGADAREFVLDHERGVIRFGDGIRGKVPKPDQPVRATWYDHGGGVAGNVGRDTGWKFADSTLEGIMLTAHGSATGGADAESTDAALIRLKSDLRRPYRAVTSEDYRYIATHTPGLRFGRAAVDVEERQGDDDCAQNGVVTVTVVPYSPPWRDRPEASKGFVDTVKCHLHRHRLLTDELVVTVPPYVPIDVETVVEVADGYAARGRSEAVESVLDEFLDPLHGFDGGGWPFGRPVYHSEVYEIIGGVEGVDCVVDVELGAGSPGTSVETGIDVPATALVYADTLTVTTSSNSRRGKWSR